jgi:hypothetical protein
MDGPAYENENGSKEDEWDREGSVLLCRRMTMFTVQVYLNLCGVMRRSASYIWTTNFVIVSERAVKHYAGVLAAPGVGGIRQTCGRDKAGTTHV